MWTKPTGKSPIGNQVPFDQEIHKQDLGQRKHFDNEVFNQANTPCWREQLPNNEVFNQTNQTNTSCQKGQLSPKNGKITPHEWEEKRHEESILPFMVDTGEKSTPTPLNYEKRKNVQFKNPETDLSQHGNTGGKRIYDPILITPRHPYNTSPYDDPPRSR